MNEQATITARIIIDLLSSFDTCTKARILLLSLAAQFNERTSEEELYRVFTLFSEFQEFPIHEVLAVLLYVIDLAEREAGNETPNN